MNQHYIVESKESRVGQSQMSDMTNYKPLELACGSVLELHKLPCGAFST